MGKETINDGVQMGSERSFSFVFATVFLLVALWPLWHGGEVRLWPLGVSIALMAIGLVCPRILKPLNFAWFKFGIWIGRFTTPVFMTLVYVVAVVPTGILLSAFGKDPMRRNIDRESQSYWITRGQQPNSMKAQF